MKYKKGCKNMEKIHLMRSYYFIILLLILIFISSCNISPPVLESDDELSNNEFIEIPKDVAQKIEDAINSRDIGICSQINSEFKDFCEDRYHIESSFALDDKKACVKIEERGLRNICLDSYYLSIVESTNEKSNCDFIIDNLAKELCLNMS